MTHHVRRSSHCGVYLMGHIEFGDTVPETESVRGHEAADVVEINVVTVRADDLVVIAVGIPIRLNSCVASTSVGVEE